MVVAGRGWWWAELGSLEWVEIQQEFQEMLLVQARQKMMTGMSSGC